MKRTRTLIAIQIVSLILGLGVLIYAVIAADVDRVDGRRDTCNLIIGLVRSTTRNSPQQRRFANEFIGGTVLRNCNTYAHTLK
jgi:hypothetical protein